MRSGTRTIPALMAILMPALAQDEPEPKSAPTGLTATLSPEGILLTWDDPGDDSITEYEIERQSFTPGRLYSERSVTVRLAPRQTHTDSRVEAGRTYSYQIWALSDTGKSEGSEIVTIRAVTDNPVDPPITLGEETYALHTFENSIKGAPLVGDHPTVQHSKGTVSYSLEGEDHSRYTIDSNGRIRVKRANSLDYETDDSDSFTVKVEDQSGATDTAVVNIEIKNLIDDDETFAITVGDDTITWTRFPETQLLVARDQEGTRRPEYELNVQLTPCIEEFRPGWALHDEYQLDMWLEDETLKYRDPDRSQLWTTHGITVPDPDHARGTDPLCPPAYTDIWNDQGSIYALDTGHRLIKAYDLDEAGTTYTRDPSRDIPVGQDHYRSVWEIQGIWGDDNTIWVSAAEQSSNEELHAAAYDRKDFTRNPDRDIELTFTEPRTDIRVIDIQEQDGVLWTVDNDNQANVIGRNPENIRNVLTCSDGDTENSIGADQGNTLQLRLTGQGDLLYTLKHETHELETYSTSACPPTAQESEFDSRDIPDRPYPYANGISTDDGLVMYFSFFPGQIRHISKLLPTLVGDSHTISITESTQGAYRPIKRSVGKPFRIREEQLVGQYSWFLEDTQDSSNSTPCGDIPAAGHESDAVHFDCQTSGNRNQSLQLLLRKNHWLDHEVKSTYTFTLRVKDVDGDTDAIRITVQVEDVDERPAQPDLPTLSEVRQQSITVGWNQVIHLLENAIPRTGLDQITGYEIEYAQEDKDPEEVEPVSGGDTVTHQLTGLHTNTSYSVRVRAINGHGNEPWSPGASTGTLRNPGPTLVDATNLHVQENTPLVDDPNTDLVEALAEVATLSATDTDEQDAITGYKILQVGRDQASFQLTPSADGTTAALHLTHVPDFEQQESYTITIRTTSGAGLREEYTDQEVTINVADLLEPPLKPDAPTLSGTSRYQTTADWMAPDNTGRPDITGYQV